MDDDSDAAEGGAPSWHHHVQVIFYKYQREKETAAVLPTLLNSNNLDLTARLVAELKEMYLFAMLIILFAGSFTAKICF